MAAATPAARPRGPLRRDARLPDVDGGLDDLGVFGMIIAAIVLVIVGIFLALVLFNVIAIALELLIVILLLLAGVFSRVVLRRPWVVQASTGGPPAQARRGRSSAGCAAAA